MVRAHTQFEPDNMTRNLLIVEPEAFHIGWLGATKRLFHLAYAFRELGFNVALLAGKATNMRLQAKIDSQFPGSVIRTHHTGAYPRPVDIKPLSRRAWRALWKVRGAEYYAGRLSFGFAETLDINKTANEIESHNLRPDLIWGVSAGYLGGATASDKLAKVFGIPWIFELQDPPRGCGLGSERATIKAEFARLLEASPKQIVVTESYRDKLLKEFNLNPKTIQAIHLTYEGKPAEEANPLQDAKWSILYAGSLQGGRSMAPLLYGLAKALDHEPQMKESFGVDIVGIGDGLDEGKKLAKDLSIRDVVRFHGYVDLERADELSYLANAFIVVQTQETSVLQVPGKIFGYMQLGRPILGIMPNCEAANILRKSGLGFVHTPEDIDGIANTLIRLWLDSREGRPSAKTDRDYIGQYSVDLLPNKLRPILEDLL